MSARRITAAAASAPLATMRSYLDALDTAPFGPPATTVSPHRILAAPDPGMLALAAERARGATALGMPAESHAPPAQRWEEIAAHLLT
ncbi:hypothetical protein ACWDTT_01690 [Streptosporangium sandarakinum]|uniref:hypothetical protein n=1 Tax=Streptosporangium sandarakinum TaxID=1260955 RepID=UPI0036A85EEE